MDNPWRQSPVGQAQEAWTDYRMRGTMGLVTGLPWGRPINRDDLDSLPDDGHRYELVDGTLLVSPAPSRRHQRAVFALGMLLSEAVAGSDVEMLIAPFEVVLPGGAVFQPDVLLAHRADLTDRDLPGAPLLVVEVVSPSTASIDRLLKYARYAQAGVRHYWIVDPDEPGLDVWRLDDAGAYAHVARVMGDEPYETTDPAVLRVVPGALVAER